jgi:hypothetical protein
MHALSCTCSKCHMRGESEWGEAEFPGAGEVYGEVGFESLLSEAEELELAAELLEVSSEEEMDQFLGKLFKGIGRGLKKVGRFIGKKYCLRSGKVCAPSRRLRSQ